MTREARTCPATGLKIFAGAETLVRANLGLAVLFFTLGLAWMVPTLLNRALGPEVIPPGLYYPALFLHGWNMIIFFTLFFEVGLLLFAATSLLETPLAGRGLAWTGLGLMLFGALWMNLLGVLEPQGVLSYTPYPPLKGSPAFYLATVLFALGLGLDLIAYFWTVHRAWRAGRNFPLAAFGALVAAILAVTTLLSGVLAFVPALLWSLGLIPAPDPLWWRVTFWGYGHGAQQVNLAAMVTAWYLLAGFTTGGTTPSERLSRWAFALYLIAINLGAAHHLLTEPTGALSSAWTWLNTGYLVHLAVLGSLIHAFSVPAAIERGLRARFPQGAFAWLKKAPWGDPAFSSLALSLVLFGLLGGITGVTMGSYDANLKWHNTLAVVGHFKATVVLGMTLAFMGLSYRLVPLLFQRELALKGLARVQPWLFGLGMSVLSLSMMVLGVGYGVPRRQGDLFTFGNASFAFHYPPEVYLLLGIMGLGGVIAALGGLYWVLVMAKTLLAPRVGERALEAYRPPEGSEVQPRGTYRLALLFLGVFFLFYLFNHYLLAQAWRLGG